MDELISSFNAKVKLNPTSFQVKGDSLLINLIMKNYGVRPAEYVTPKCIIILSNGATIELPNPKTAELLPNGNHLEIPLKDDFTHYNIYGRSELNSCLIILRVIFTDAITGKIDSSTSYSEVHLDLSGFGKITLAREREINFCDEKNKKHLVNNAIKRLLNSISDPPSNSFQKINLILSTIIPIIIVILSIYAYLHASKIKGMQEMLMTYRPYVDITPMVLRVKGDTMNLEIKIQNLGGRQANNVYIKIFFEFNNIDSAIQVYGDTLYTSLSPTEVVMYSPPNAFRTPSVTDSVLQSLTFISRSIYPDNIEKTIDTVFSYFTVQYYNGNQMIFQLANTDQIRIANAKLKKSKLKDS